MTKALAQLAQATDADKERPPMASVVLSGPYGQSVVDDYFYHDDEVNLFFVAGGTGVTFVLPPLLALTTTQQTTRRGLVEFVWVIRRPEDLKWIEPELHQLRRAAESCSNFRIRIFVTRGSDAISSEQQPQTTTAIEPSKETIIENNARPSPASSAPSLTGQQMKEETFVIHQPSSSACLALGDSEHPDLVMQVTEFVHRTVAGPTRVVASGPLSMISDLRGAVAELNSPKVVWRGEERHDVQLLHDDRLEY